MFRRTLCRHSKTFKHILKKPTEIKANDTYQSVIDDYKINLEHLRKDAENGALAYMRIMGKESTKIAVLHWLYQYPRLTNITVNNVLIRMIRKSTMIDLTIKTGVRDNFPTIPFDNTDFQDFNHTYPINMYNHTIGHIQKVHGQKEVNDLLINRIYPSIGMDIKEVVLEILQTQYRRYKSSQGFAQVRHEDYKYMEEHFSIKKGDDNQYQVSLKENNKVCLTTLSLHEATKFMLESYFLTKRNDVVHQYKTNKHTHL